ncbi:MAG: amidohydrolase family protein [Bacteroidota bacterium]
MRDHLILWLAVIALLAGSVSGCTSRVSEFYSADDFRTVPKIDVHFHYETLDGRYMRLADSLNFRLVSPNVDAGRSISEQLHITTELKKRYPEKFAFFGTFGVEHYGSEDFAGRIISRIDSCMAAGASGIKIWKNIGMTLKDSNGNYIMADDPAFAPVFSYMEEKNIRLLAHLGEPRNCWLPLEEMTLDNDRSYFRNNPQYHMYLHPEAPSYEDQIRARDNLLERYPGIRFTGAHLGSQEWSIDEVAKNLDRFPAYDVEFSARIGHLQYQAITEPGKVHDFLIKYQDRIMYGTDVGVSGRNTNYAATAESLVKRWYDHFVWLATDAEVIVADLNGTPVKGLQLPKEVIDKIYFTNAEKFFR